MDDDLKRRNGDKLTVRTLTGWVTSVGILIAAVFAVNNHFVTHDDFFNAIHSIQYRQIVSEKDRISDNIYSIESKPRQSDQDRAEIARYQGRLDNMNIELQKLNNGANE